MLNREVFSKDPTTFAIPNDGVTVVGDPQRPEEWDVLRYELRRSCARASTSAVWYVCCPPTSDTWRNPSSRRSG